MNHAVVYQLQDIFNLLPDVADQQFVKCVHTKTNDQMLVVYLASLTRSVIALHNLINNKLTNRFVDLTVFISFREALMVYVIISLGMPNVAKTRKIKKERKRKRKRRRKRKKKRKKKLQKTKVKRNKK